MNILFFNIFFVGFIVSEIPRMSVFGHCPYSTTSPYINNICFKTYFKTYNSISFLNVKTLL